MTIIAFLVTFAFGAAGGFALGFHYTRQAARMLWDREMLDIVERQDKLFEHLRRELRNVKRK